jgi:hypothetical protein
MNIALFNFSSEVKSGMGGDNVVPRHFPSKHMGSLAFFYNVVDFLTSKCCCVFYFCVVCEGLKLTTLVVYIYRLFNNYIYYKDLPLSEWSGKILPRCATLHPIEVTYES